MRPVLLRAGFLGRRQVLESAAAGVPSQDGRESLNLAAAVNWDHPLVLLGFLEHTAMARVR